MVYCTRKNCFKWSPNNAIGMCATLSSVHHTITTPLQQSIPTEHHHNHPPSECCQLLIVATGNNQTKERKTGGAEEEKEGVWHNQKAKLAMDPTTRGNKRIGPTSTPKKSNRKAKTKKNNGVRIMETSTNDDYAERSSTNLRNKNGNNNQTN